MKKMYLPNLERLKHVLQKLDYVLILIFASSLLLRFFVPQTAGGNSPHDDFLAVSQARSILDGKWLGGWDGRTLSKPAGHPIFLAIVHFTQLSPSFVIHFLYLTLVLTLILKCMKLFNLHPTSTLIFRRFFFLILAFNPTVFGSQFSRTYRSSLTTVLILAFLLNVILFYSKIVEPEKLKSQRDIQKLFLLHGSFFGFIYFCLIFTRSEAIWLLYPTLAGIVALLAYLCKKSFMIPKKLITRFILMGIIAGCTSFGVPYLVISQANKYAYGSAMVESYYSGEYARAFKLWEGVKDGEDPRLFITVSKGQRSAVYQISATAALLEPYLDGAPNTGWKTQSCNSPLKVCDESALWFGWELRDAAIAAGDLKNESEFQKFFKQIGDDIEIACEEKSLNCGPPGLTAGAKNLTAYPLRQLLDTTVKMISVTLNAASIEDITLSNTGEPNTQPIWKSVVNFEEFSSKDDISRWIVMGNTLKFLNQIFKVLIWLLLILTILSWLTINSLRNISKTQFITLYLFMCLMLYWMGLSVFESSLGIEGPVYAYIIIVQPILLFALTLSSIEMISKITRNMEKFSTNSS